MHKDHDARDTLGRSKLRPRWLRAEGCAIETRARINRALVGCARGLRSGAQSRRARSRSLWCSASRSGAAGGGGRFAPRLFCRPVAAPSLSSTRHRSLLPPPLLSGAPSLRAEGYRAEKGYAPLRGCFRENIVMPCFMLAGSLRLLPA